MPSTFVPFNITSASNSIALKLAAESVVKNGLPVPDARTTIRPFSKCLSALLLTYFSQTAFTVKDDITLQGISIFSKELCKAKELMTKNVITCNTKNTTEELLELMVKKHFRHIPVIQNNKLIGVVSIGDLVKDRTKRLKKEIDQLKSYVTKSY